MGEGLAGRQGLAYHPPLDPRSSTLYPHFMPQIDRAKLTTGIIGAVALAAWFAMLWFMFGDVL